MEQTYRTWELDHAYMGYVATHPDYDGPEDNRIVWGATLDKLREEIDLWIEENEDADNTPHAFVFGAPMTCKHCGNDSFHPVHKIKDQK